jgi:hypothetical protein
MFEFLKPKRSSSITFVEVGGALDYSAIPRGFFQVITASGKESLGYRGTFTTFDCGTTVVDGKERHSLSIPRDQLPIVKLNFSSQQSDGTQTVRGVKLMDTADLGEQFSGDFIFDPLR